MIVDALIQSSPNNWLGRLMVLLGLDVVLRLASWSLLALSS
jgi:hypothetical protein